MVVRMMNWRPWPPLSSKKFEAKIVVRCLQGLSEKTTSRVAVEVKWKGSGKSNNPLNFKRSSVKRNLTKEASLDDDGVVEWNEEFVGVCDLVGLKDGCFHQWEVAFKVFDGLNQGPKQPDHAAATGSLNLAEFASAEREKTTISINLSVPSNTECNPILSVSLSLLELRTPHEVNKIFRVISANRAKKACREEESSDGKSSSTDYPFDTDSLDETDSVDSEEVDYGDSNVKKSFSYGTLAYANHSGGLSCSNSSGSEDDDWIFYGNYKEKGDDLNISVIDRLERRSLKQSIFPWRKRKLGFRSPKGKGEPLLRKDFGEEGGDDIDFDRRMLSSSDDSTYGAFKSDEGLTTSQCSTSEFGDDTFTIGTWENKEITSREGHMNLKTQVFFASIDQRSEKASGESACTTLVATIADWFQNNPHEMPIKSQLDTLIRQGSLEWRSLCENEDYRKRFPNKHFDLETVFQAKTRNLGLVPEKSFVGFFKGLEEEGSFDFLDGAMSFDAIWEEISRNTNPLVYIVSWNDHFFILKVENDAYYIIDTLGERLYEGCNQAYVLKFDKDTEIRKCKKVNEKTEVWKGKESCKEYIKRFLAEIPIRELEADLKKGLMAESTPLIHHRLQIEFHYTNSV